MIKGEISLTESKLHDNGRLMFKTIAIALEKRGEPSFLQQTFSATTLTPHNILLRHDLPDRESQDAAKLTP
jgi:hypothetical protein